MSQVAHISVRYQVCMRAIAHGKPEALLRVTITQLSHNHRCSGRNLVVSSNYIQVLDKTDSSNNMNGNARKSAIVLIPDRFIKKAMENYFTRMKEVYSEFEITLVADDDDGTASPFGLYNHVITLIESSKNPPLVIPTHDIGALVHSALTMKFPHIRAPSFLSEVFTVHKGQTYKLTPKECTLPYLELTPDAVVEYSELTNAGINFPVFIKPSFGTNSNMVRKVIDMDQLNAFLEKQSEGISSDAGEISEFILEILMDHSMKADLTRTWIVQPFAQEDATLVCLDGMVCQGNVTMWNIHEFVFWGKGSSALKCIASPVDLSKEAGENLRKAYDHIAKELMSRGFDNQFACLEAFVTRNGKVSIVEVNGRILRVMTRNYLHMYGQNGDNIMAMFQIADGKVPKAPILNKDVHACLGYVCLSSEGVAKNFIDFDIAECLQEMDLNVSENTSISSPGEWGHQVAYCYTSGRTREEAIDKCRGLVDRIIITKDKCKWLTS